MTTYNTGNPVGSSDVKDIFDNAQNLDLLSVGVANAYADRLGKMRKSWAGFEQDFIQFLLNSGYEIPIPYVAGISVTRPTQTFIYNGEIYRAKIAALPFTTTNWATDSPNMIAMGDSVLRQDLASALGAYMVGFGTSTVGAIIEGLDSVKEFGAVGDGVADDSDFIQDAVNAGDVYFPAGDYLITKPIYVPSNRKLSGAGYRSRIRISPTASGVPTAWAGTLWFAFCNSNIVSSGANSHIEITGLQIDGTGHPQNPFLTHFRNCQYVTVDKCTLVGGGDGTAFTLSHNWKVSNCFAYGQMNCSYDSWEGSSEGLYENNIGYTSLGYGMLCTGDTSLNTPMTSANVSFIGNISIGSSTNDSSVGIWLQSGNNLTSNCYTCRVIGNFVRGFRVGIRATGGGAHVIQANTVQACPNGGLVLSAEVIGNGTKGNTVSNNIINNCGSVTDNPLVLQSGASNNYLSGNIVTGTLSPYSVLLDASTDGNVFDKNVLDVGTSGYLFDGGTANLCNNTRTGFYGESSFTPFLGSTGGGTPTYAVQFGRVQFIGKWAHFTARVAVSSLGSLAAGQLFIGGLPVTAKNDSANNQPAVAGDFGNCQASVASAPNGRVISGTTQVNLYKWASGSTIALNVSDITGTFEANISGKYQV